MESLAWQLLLVSISVCTYSAALSDTDSLAHLLSGLPVLSRLTSQTFVSLNA